ncbi:hypothetical protein [Lysobacter arvi]|uniref:Tryptophan-rich sensory protein n=1 Tax=Lysobacter arvi TaxID=3038776 RepID=A0ABU1C9T1_9GAMM|nr:hypothetical protein [Lysobacter arvi]MDR0181951.1 hypothetical protein [Lysobacter arvi]
MRYLALLAALSMPLVAWLTTRGAFGPDTGDMSDRYPTLLAAAGYAFAIWGLIFLLDVAYGLWQVFRQSRPRRDPALPAATAGFVLTAAWMPVFSLGWFVAAWVIIVAALACVLYGAISLSQSRRAWPGQMAFAWLPLSLHAGWLSLAAFLNTAQLIVAHGWLSIVVQLPWSIVLLAGAAALLMLSNRAMRGNLAYVAAAVWGLIAMYVKQSGTSMEGASVTAVSALVLAAALVAQYAWLRRSRYATRIGEAA